MITCTCGAGKGFTNLDTTGGQWWVCVKCEKPTEAWLMSQGDELLNFFKGGPIDGYAYDTLTLIQSPQHVGHIPITEYRWTEEIVTSEKTGRHARVWVHKSTPVMETTVVSTSGAGQSSPASQKEDTRMAKNIMKDSGNGLLDRRTELKLSRRVVADQAGITQAQLATIEKGGARVTDEDVANVRKALDALAPAADPS